MRVLYDITTLGNIHCAPGVNGSGIFRATEDLAAALVDRDDVDLAWSASPHQYQKALRYLTEAARLPLDRFAFPGGSDARSRLIAAAHSPLLSADSELRHGLDTAFTAGGYDPASIYNGGRFDVYHANWRAEQRLPEHAHPAVLLTVFDIIALKHPEWFAEPGAANAIGDYLQQVIASVGTSHSIVVNTSSVKQDILERFAMVSDEQISVVPLGVGDRITKCDDADRITEVRARYGIPEGHRYVLCVNTIEPRKNMEAAIDAFVQLHRSGGSDDLTLVLAGANGWLYDDIVGRSGDAASVHGASIVMTGFIADADMSALYSGASCFCYPSLDEGFGLPVLEAMKCGIPVVTSRRAPLQEVAGDCAVIAEPTDSGEIAAAIESILTDDALAADLATRGAERANSFTWQRSADVLVDTYERIGEDAALRRRSGGSGSSRSDSRGLLTRRLAEIDADNDALDALAGAFEGEQVFILGDGRGLRRAPLSLLGDKITIAINGAYSQLEHQSWKPTIQLVDADTLDEPAAESINGLTGSTFLFPESLAETLRSGSDIVVIAPDDDRLIDTSHLAAEAPGLSGPARSIATAIRVAEHGGASDIVLIEPEVDVGWGGHQPGAGSSRSDVLDFLRRVDDSSRQDEHPSVHILAETDVAVPFHRLSTEQLLLGSTVDDHGRDAHAHIDETEALAAFFPTDGRHRTMLDVGAHRGTSAIFFVERPWTIHCFEPDPDNRGHLERRLGQRSNIIIDPRAVGATPAAGVSFFSSEESSGISGLAAFRPTHRAVATVEVTTVADVVEERAIEHVDFLKIDVEGFDFDVLRGVPWDEVRPDVIECEYEDAKTIAHGHSWRDIADFLQNRGYAVYVSEWHPIVRYGVTHDWRRVVPYPGIDVPSNSWGNLIAFRTDPGLAAVSDLFRRHVTTGSGAPPSGSATTPSPADAPSAPGGRSAPAPKQAPGRSAPALHRPRYADTADRLRHRVPAAYSALRLIRRVLVRAKRFPAAITAAVLFVIAAVAAGILAPSATARLAIWGAAAVLALTVGLLGVALYANKTAVRLSTEVYSLSKYKKSNRKDLRQLRRQYESVRAELRATGGQIDRVRQDVVDVDARLHAAIGQQIERTDAALSTATEAIQQLDLESGALRSRVEATEAGILSSEVEIQAVHTQIRSIATSVQGVRVEIGQTREHLDTTINAISRIDGEIAALHQASTPTASSANASGSTGIEPSIADEDPAPQRDDD